MHCELTPLVVAARTTSCLGISVLKLASLLYLWCQWSPGLVRVKNASAA